MPARSAAAARSALSLLAILEKRTEHSLPVRFDQERIPFWLTAQPIGRELRKHALKCMSRIRLNAHMLAINDEDSKWRLNHGCRTSLPLSLPELLSYLL